LTNVHRHSGSVEARVSIDRRPVKSCDCVVLTVEDWGKGMPERVVAPAFAGAKPALAAGASSLGVGLAGMAERLAQLGGELHIESRQAGGTLVRAVLPMDEAIAPLLTAARF
jgi:signal transduction histidine kinase